MNANLVQILSEHCKSFCNNEIQNDSIVNWDEMYNYETVWFKHEYEEFHFLFGVDTPIFKFVSRITKQAISNQFKAKIKEYVHKKLIFRPLFNWIIT